MKKIFMYLQVVVLLSSLFLPGSLLAQNNILVVTGVLEEQAVAGSGLKVCLDAIKEGCKNENIPVEYIFSNLNEAAGEAVITEETKKAVEKIHQAKPGALIVLNDFTIKYITPHINDIPIVVAYFFSNPQTLGLPRPNITGITRGSYAVDIWKMANQLTGAKTVGMLSKKSFAMEGVKQVMMAKAPLLAKASGVKFVDMYLCDTYEEWKKRVQNWTEELMYVVDSSRLIDGNRQVMPEESMKWTVANAKVPIVATSEYDTRYGALFSIVTSEKAWALQAVGLAKKILAGTPVSSLPMETVTKGDLLINAATAQKLNIQIPYEILESATKVYE